MKLSDAHIHLFRHGYPGRYGPLFPMGDIVVYEKIREEHKIEQALVVGYEGESWARGNNRYIAHLAQKCPWIVPLAYCDPARGLTAKGLAAWWGQGFAGLSLYIQKREEIEALLNVSNDAVSELNHKRAILSINCPPRVADQLQTFFIRLEQTRILISHFGMPEAMPGALRQLRPVFENAKIPHLGIKLSGAHALNPYPHPGLVKLTMALQDAYGETRLYWGSDFSPALDSVTFSQTIDIGLPNGIAEKKIYSENLSRVFRRVRRECVA